MRLSNAPGHPAVFWLLISLGIAAFTPCILLPEWRQHQAVHAAESREQQKVRQMEGMIDREKRLLEGMQSDPAVIARIAQRDLHFRPPADLGVVIEAPELSADPSNDDAGSGAVDFDALAIDDDAVVAGARRDAGSLDLPRFLQPYLARLPAYDYDAIFCDPQTRPIVMGLSVALIATAVLVFSSRNRHVLPRS